MESRKRIFIGIGVAVGLVIVFLLAYRVLAPGGQGNTSENVVTSTVQSGAVGTNVSPNTPTPAETPTPRVAGVVDGVYLRQLARLVVEWSGSFSNQNDNSHIETVEPFVTAKLLNFLRSRAPQPSDIYAGVTTRVVVSTLKEKKATDATVTVGVQQSGGDVASTSSYRTGSVHIVNDSGTWKVDGIFWDK